MRSETTEKVMIGLILAAIGLAVAGGVVVVSAISVLLIPVPFALGLAAAFALLTLHEPRWSLLFTFATMPYERLMALFPPEGTSQQGFLNTLTLTKVMLFMIIPIWVVKVLVMKDDSVFRKTFATPIPAVALIFAFYTQLSMVNAANMGGFIKNQSTIISNVVLFLLALNLMDDKKWILRSIKVLFVGYVVVGFMGVFEVATGTHVLELMGHEMPEEAFVMYGKAFRPAGPSGDPDYFATSILFGLMLTLAMWRFTKSWLLWAFYVVLCGVFMFDIFATGSRGAMLGFLTAMGAFWFFLEMPYKVPVAAVAIIGGLTFFTGYTVLVSGRAAGRYSGEETKSLEYRLGWQGMSLKMVEEHPMLGVGMGNHVFNQHRLFDPRPPRNPENSANTYAQLAAEAGIPALFLYVGFFCLVLLFLIKVCLGADDPDVRHLATCLLAALSAFFVFAVTAHALYNEVTWTLLGLSVSLGLAARESVAPGYRAEDGGSDGTRSRMNPATSSATSADPFSV